MRIIALFAVVALVGCFRASGADRYYLGALGGIAALSGDAGSSLSPTGAQASNYNPSNGPAVNVFAGLSLSNYISLQINYIQNSNELAFFSTNATAQHVIALQESRDSSQKSIVADALLYFRSTRSEFRPYLSAGMGATHLSSTQTAFSGIGNPEAPSRDFSSTNAVLRVAVGIDVKIRHGWAFRYSFSESTSHNPLSDRLAPPGSHALMNFQNLFGFLKTF